MFTVTKQYRDLPAAHRQPNHDGHCKLIHGHNWGFDIEFSCRDLDSNGFVVDVGKLQEVREWLKETFDHTLLINLADPLRKELIARLYGIAKIQLVPNCGMEGLARLVFESVNGMLDLYAERGVVVLSVTCHEDSKNSATYRPE